MVEFGLKLADNKVSEWSDHYIDYETLKILLDELNDSVKQLDELESKSPSLASKLRNNFLAITRQEEAEENEFTKLIDKKEKSYSTDIHSLKAEKSSQDQYKRKYEESLASVDSARKKISECLYKEVDKVNSFYNTKFSELEAQLSLLIDSAKKNIKLKEDSDDFKSSLAEEIVTNIRHFFRKSMGRFISNRALNIELEHVDWDEEESTSSYVMDSVDEHVVRVSESIKRALAELYRTSKLLNNFAHLNSTALAKVIKKFKNICPDKKARFDLIVMSEGHEG